MAVDFNRLRVLIVEDNDYSAKFIRTVLGNLGIYQVFTARNGKDALRFVDSAEEMINFIICDWNMPHMTGYEFLCQVRSVDPNIPFLMVTARATVDAVKAAQDKGVSAYIAKPYKPEELERKVVALAKSLNPSRLN